MSRFEEATKLVSKARWLGIIDWLNVDKVSQALSTWQRFHFLQHLCASIIAPTFTCRCGGRLAPRVLYEAKGNFFMRNDFEQRQ
jgi:hypothetical protein